MQQQPSPALSSPSTSFFGPRVSPLFTPSIDQPDPLPITCSDLPPFRPPPPLLDSSLPLPDNEQAPPKQLALAMEGLGQAIRLIAEVRLGADLLLEALERATAQRRSEASSNKASEWVVAAADAMRESLDALRATGRKLESSGVLNGAQQRFEEKQPWGLQVPLVCPDGAIVPYSWKRQIAGQAAASAVDRTRLALKAFTQQKRHFFPRLGDSAEDSAESFSTITFAKRPRSSASIATHGLEQGVQDETSDGASLSDLLLQWQQEVPDMLISSFTRLDWTKRTSAGLKVNEAPGPVSIGLLQSVSRLKLVKQEPALANTVNSGSGQESGSLDAGPLSMDNVAILEVTIPTSFKAVVSLLPAATMCPDGMSIFALEEVGSHVHPVGVSIHNVFRRISEYGKTALHSFLRFSRSTALALLLEWLYTYRSLLTKPCSQCKRILAFDHPSDLLLPPVVRPLNQVLRTRTSKLAGKLEALHEDKILAYHVACAPKDESGVL